MTYDDLVACFPHETIREPQETILRFAADNWDKRLLLFSAPTGVGKSALGVSIGKASRSSVILTSTKILQKQYQNDMRHIPILMGRNEYRCALNKQIPVDSSPCMFEVKKRQIAQCREGKVCPYYNAVDRSQVAQTYVTSYAYFMAAPQCRTDKRETIVLDEAHELENILIQYSAVTIAPMMLVSKYDVGINTSPITEKNMMARCESIRDDVGHYLGPLAEKIASYGCRRPEDVSAAEAKHVSDLEKKWTALSKIHERLTAFLEAPGNFYSGVCRPKTGDEIRIYPKTGESTFANKFASSGQRFVAMSACLGDHDILARGLGFAKDEYAVVTVDSPFEPTRSPVYVVSSVDLSFNKVDANVGKLATQVDDILDAHVGERGIVHTGNTRLANELWNRCARRTTARFFGNKDGRIKENNDKLFDQFKLVTGDKVLVSPSMHTGIDLKDDLGRFQIIAKLPWAEKGDPYVSARNKMGDGWYENDMLKRLIQACGRTTRTEDDYSKTYVLDSGIDGIVRRKWWSLPRWFRDRLVF